MKNRYYKPKKVRHNSLGFVEHAQMIHHRLVNERVVKPDWRLVQIIDSGEPGRPATTLVYDTTPHFPPPSGDD